MGAFVVAIILLSGYIFVATSTWQQIKTRRTDGHRYYFRCGAYGVFFCVIGVSLIYAIDLFNIPSTICLFAGVSTAKFLNVVSILTRHEILSIKMAIGLLLAMPIAGLAGILQNKFKNINNSTISEMSEINVFESFLNDAAMYVQPIMITMTNKKVYVGIVKEVTLESSGTVEHFLILPVLSGYRDKDTLSVKFTTNYYRYYATHLDDEGVARNGGAGFEDFVEMIPVSQVAHIGQFDIDTYKAFREIEDLELPDDVELNSIKWSDNSPVVVKSDYSYGYNPEQSIDNKISNIK